MNEDRIKKLRNLLRENYIDGYLISDKAGMNYISGFTGTYGKILITKNRKIIFADGRYFEQLRKQAPDFEIVDNHMRMTEYVQKTIKKLNLDVVGFEPNELTAGEYLKLVGSEIKLKPIEHLIENLRMIKDCSEISKIKKAGNIADQAFNHILSFIKSGMTELEVAREIDRYGLKHGADSTAFETIVSSGTRSSLPHGHATNKIIEKNGMIILDFGFMVDGYYSDITRTIAIGNVDEKLKKAYYTVLNAQQRAIKHCKLGTKLSDLDAIAREYITNEGFGPNFLHGTGHGIGLTVHEYPLLNSDSLESVKEGETFTVEPGIYLENLGGIRIEDDVLIDKIGTAHLLTHASKEWIEL